MKLIIATGHGAPGLFHDDQHLPEAFAAHGVEVVAMDWKTIEPGSTPVLIRTPWDYAQHAAAFAAWFNALQAAGTPVINPVALMQWNLDKRYLLELEAKGHAIVPTEIAPLLAAAPAIAQAQGWHDAIIKPVVGGGAEGLHRWRNGRLEELPATGNAWGAAKASGPCLVQPFLPEIQDGEWSLYFFGGDFSHAVLKRPAGGDIRVQEEHGGRTAGATPPEQALAAATAMMQDVPEAVYARADGVMVDGRFLLMELEMIEPELYFRYTDGAEARFAAAVACALAETAQNGSRARSGP